MLVVDAQDGLTAQDDHVAGYALDEGKGIVLAINKWDLVEKDEHTFDEFAAAIRQAAPFLDIAPIVAISAKTGQRVGRVLEAAFEIAAERRRRIPTPAVNSWLREATMRRPAPGVRGRQTRFYYGAQVAIAPPTFVLFASEAATIHFSYRRYLENQLRETFGFAGTPIRVVIRERARVKLESRTPAATRKSAKPAKGGGGKKAKANAQRRAASSGHR